MILELARCLDKSAFCELKVLQVAAQGAALHKVSRLLISDGYEGEPPLSPNNWVNTPQNENMAAQTKS